MKFMLLLLLVFSSANSFAVNGYLNLSGKILKPDQTPLTSNNVTFTISVMKPGSSTCVLYSETLTVDMSSSNGMFDLALGTGTIGYDASTSLQSVFSNTSSLTCQTTAVYSPVATDGRDIKIQFEDQNDSSPMLRTFGTIAAQSVPQAFVAGTAEKLGTNVASDFVLKSSVNGNVTCGSGSFLTWDATAQTFGCAAVTAGNSGTVTQVTSTSSYLTVANGASTPALSLNVGTTANTLAAGNDSRIVSALQSGTTAGGDLSGTYPNPSVAKLNTVPLAITSLNSGQFLKYNGTNWVNAAIAEGDVTGLATSLASYMTTAAFNTDVASATCSTSQTMYWNSVSSAFACQTIVVTNFSGNLAGDVTGTQSATKVTALQNHAVATTTPTTNQVLTWNGTAWTPTTPAASGTLTSITAGTGLTGGTITTSGTIAVDVGSSAGKIVQLDATAKLPALDGSALLNLNAANLATGTISTLRMPALLGDVTASAGTNTTTLGKIQGIPVNLSSLTNGNFLKYNGSAWVNAALSSSDIPAGVILGSGTTNSVPIFNAANSIVASPNLYVSSGNLGIGTAAPSALVHIKAGTSAAGTAPLKFMTGTVLTTPEVGAVEFDGSSLYFTDSTAARRTILTTGSNTFSGVTNISNSSSNITLSPPTSTGAVVINATTPSSNTTTGALIVSGGLGVAGNIYAGGTMNAPTINGTTINATNLNASTSLIAPQIYGSSTASGNVKIDGTSNATVGNVLLASNGGKVGIGTSLPSQLLDIMPSPSTGDGLAITMTGISAGAQYPATTMTTYGGGSPYNNMPRTIFNMARGTKSAPQALVNGDSEGGFVFNGYNGSGFQQGAAIYGFAQGTLSGSNYSGSLGFYNTNIMGSSATLILNYDHTSNFYGSVLPATTAAYDLGSSASRWGTVYASNSFNQSSDRRLKKNIEKIDLGLDFINGISPVSYEWKQDTQFPENPKTHWGFIAQDLEKEIQNKSIHRNVAVVNRDQKTDMYSVAYTELISPIVRAIQELSAKFVGDHAVIEQQSQKIDALQKENERLASTLTSLQTALCEKDPSYSFCLKN